MITIRFLTGYFQALIYWLKIELNQLEKIAFLRVKIICDKYSVLLPESLIIEVKYFASTFSDKGPNFSPAKENPADLLVDILEKIEIPTYRILYLKRLLNQLPKVPAAGAPNVTDFTFYKEFYSLVLDELRFFKKQNWKAIRDMDKYNDFFKVDGDGEKQEGVKRQLNSEMVKLINEIAKDITRKGNSSYQAGTIVTYLKTYVKRPDLTRKERLYECIKVADSKQVKEELKDRCPPNTLGTWERNLDKRIEKIASYSSLFAQE